MSNSSAARRSAVAMPAGTCKHDDQLTCLSLTWPVIGVLLFIAQAATVGDRAHNVIIALAAVTMPVLGREPVAIIGEATP